MNNDTSYATYEAWAEAFAIFAKYEPNTAFEVSAEHDVIYAGRKGASYSDEDKKRLEELHWNYDTHVDCYRKYV